jgi:predicted TIM-barrel fold metal-dependent hydrolase
MQIDVHQHIWTEPLLDALSARRRLPFVRRTDEQLTVLHSSSERPYVIDVAAEAPAARAKLLRADRADRAVIAISSPIGIEALPYAEARELISAHLDGVLDLGDGFAAWGPLPIETPDPADVDELVARGCVGVSLPAPALAGGEALHRLGPVMERLQDLGLPLFVHPGGTPDPRAAEASLTEPLWWRALTDYVSQMQASWLTFASYGRRELPSLTIVFAMLAGGAPLLSERLATRGGPPVELRDPLTFYDTSSYGPQLLAAMARWVGPGQLLYGSDRPVVEPVRTGREVELMSNAAELLGAAMVPV